MRTSLCFLVALSSLATLAVVGAGCGALPADCPDRFRCATGGGASTSSGGGGGSTPTACVPKDNTTPVADDCGVFVSTTAGAEGAAGTKAAPLKTLDAAVKQALAMNQRAVYACAEEFDEALRVEGAIEIYGGLDCANGWGYVGASTKTRLTAAPDAVPLTIASGSDVALADLVVQAKNAAKDGGSSIAVIVDHAAASFTRADIIAGGGRAGVAGTMPAEFIGPNDPDSDQIKGENGKDACFDVSLTPGGAAKENPSCTKVMGGPVGGKGGNGFVFAGENALAQPPTPQTALGGFGQPADPTPWSCVVGNGSGTSGNVGLSGLPGAGGTSLGTIDATGYTGAHGGEGTRGAPGQGGGGGGGAKGKAGCAGASGGAGGVGGCGGFGGSGGQAGGASIGLISLEATLTFDGATITTSNGGDGGDGGNGQSGAIGGNGGKGGIKDDAASMDGCAGGKGGSGGNGGKGGGGRGGHTIGIAFTGAAPETTNVSITKGSPGFGGEGADVMHGGADGMQADTVEFE